MSFHNTQYIMGYNIMASVLGTRMIIADCHVISSKMQIVENFLGLAILSHMLTGKVDCYRE